MKKILLFLGILLPFFITNSSLIINFNDKRDNKTYHEMSKEILINSIKTSEKTEYSQINLTLPFKIFDSPFVFADLFSILSKVLLPSKNIINNIDIKTAGTLEFITKYNELIEMFDEGLYPLIKEHLLNIDLNFDYAVAENLKIIGTGTVRDILHNIAPDVIGFLQWYSNSGYKQVLEKHSNFLSFFNSILKPLNLSLKDIYPNLWEFIAAFGVNNYHQLMEKHNMVLFFLQYWLSPVNYDLKALIGKEYGTKATCWFYHHTRTNFDSLIFHLLSGYKSNSSMDKNKYQFKLVGSIKVNIMFYLYFNDFFDQNLIGNQVDLNFWNLNRYVYLELEPSLLLASVLDAFARNNNEEINILNDSFIIVDTCKGISSIVSSRLPAINVFFGTIIMQLVGTDVLDSLKISNKDIKTGQIRIIGGTVQLMLKNQVGDWVPLNFTVRNNAPYFSQILVAVDFKFSFKNIDFNMIINEEYNIFYCKKKKYNFDLRLSNEI